MKNNVRENIGFKKGPIEKSILQRFIGGYVLFDCPKSYIGGFFKGIEGDGREYCILNPYQKIVYFGGIPKMSLYEDEEGEGKPIEVNQISSVEHYPRKEILAFCDYWNLQEQVKYLDGSRGIVVVGPVQAREFLKKHGI